MVIDAELLEIIESEENRITRLKEVLAPGFSFERLNGVENGKRS